MSRHGLRFPDDLTGGQCVVHWLRRVPFEYERQRFKAPPGCKGFTVKRWFHKMPHVYILRDSVGGLIRHEFLHVEKGHFHD